MYTNLYIGCKLTKYLLKIFLQRHQSSETLIVLRSVDMDTTGRFKCEVSGEAPLFQTASEDEILAVVGKPICLFGFVYVSIVAFFSLTTSHFHTLSSYIYYYLPLLLRGSRVLCSLRKQVMQ